MSIYHPVMAESRFPLVKKITDNYVARKIKCRNDVEPLLSFDEKIQKEHKELVENGAE